MKARMGSLNCDGGTTGLKGMHGFRPETASSLDIVPVLRGAIFEGAIFGGAISGIFPPSYSGRLRAPAPPWWIAFEGSHFWLPIRALAPSRSSPQHALTPIVLQPQLFSGPNRA